MTRIRCFFLIGSSFKIVVVALLCRWQQYLQIRMGGGGVVQPAMLDGISFSLTALRGLHRCFFEKNGGWNKAGQILLVAIGAARKTEQRILEDTQYVLAVLVLAVTEHSVLTGKFSCLCR